MYTINDSRNGSSKTLSREDAYDYARHIISELGITDDQNADANTAIIVEDKTDVVLAIIRAMEDGTWDAGDEDFCGWLTVNGIDYR
jgi:hypothetical protein